MGAASNALGDLVGNALAGAGKFVNFAAQAGIWSFSIPSNYQIGNVGNSGEKTTATHLHFEFQKVKR